MTTVTKGDLVNQMFVMLRISGITANPSPEDMEDALNILERIVLALENKGLFLGWNKSSNLFMPNPDEQSGLGDKNVNAIVLLLAKNVAPTFGKALSNDLLDELKDAMEALYSSAPPTRVQNPYQPAGQGDRRFCHSDRYYNRYMPSEERLNVTNGGQLEDLVVTDRRGGGFHGN